MRAKVYYDYQNNPNSSALRDVWYDGVNKELYVEFPNGTIAGYTGVPVETYDGLVNASSVGQYFTYKIKGYYTGISGDVEFFQRPVSAESVHVAPVPVLGSTRFEVVIKIDGDLKLQVTAVDFGDASDQVTRLLNEITTASYTVLSVTRNA